MILLLLTVLTGLEPANKIYAAWAEEFCAVPQPTGGQEPEKEIASDQSPEGTDDDKIPAEEEMDYEDAGEEKTAGGEEPAAEAETEEETEPPEGGAEEETEPPEGETAEEEFPGEEETGDGITEDSSAELEIEAAAVPETAKAGRDLLYKAVIKNTGQVVFENILLRSSFAGMEQRGVWEELSETETDGGNLRFDRLEAGEERTFYLKLSLDESQDVPVELGLAVEAQYKRNGGGASEEWEKIKKEISLVTPILPLKADFQVTKSADRTMAAAGDRIIFQICIRNTGERTLHSVLTTEKFQTEKIPVEFLEKDGVQLNQTKTKALVSRIGPGQAVSLQAAVDLPEDIKTQELINEVTVVAAETGRRTVSARAKVQVYQITSDEDGPGVLEADADMPAVRKSYPASSRPATGDPEQPALWTGIFLSFSAAAGFLGQKLRRLDRKTVKGRRDPGIPE